MPTDRELLQQARQMISDQDLCHWTTAHDHAVLDAIDEAIQERKWRGLTTAETKVLWNLTKKPREYAQMIETKLKDRNA